MADTGALDMARYIDIADATDCHDHAGSAQTYLNTKLARVDADNGPTPGSPPRRGSGQRRLHWSVPDAPGCYYSVPASRPPCNASW